MKKLALLLSAVYLVAGLSACATMGPAADTAKVKCPACGHEFLSTTNPELVPKK